jgi:hypothetical protein
VIYASEDITKVVDAMDKQKTSNSGKVVASVFSQVSFKQMIDEVLANCIMSSL